MSTRAKPSKPVSFRLAVLREIEHRQRWTNDPRYLSALAWFRTRLEQSVLTEVVECSGQP